MALYKITDSENNENSILSDLAFVQSLCADNDWTYQEIEQPQAEFAPVTPQKIITKFQFLSRFTNDELVTIYTAAKQSVQLEVYLAKINAASEIDLSLQDVIDGVNALETMALIANGRALEILTP